MSDKGKGYVRFYRSIWDSEFFKGDKFSRRDAWMYIISHAAYKKQTINNHRDIFSIDRGQMFTSIRKLANEFGWGRDTVSRFLRDTETMEMTEVRQTHNGTLLTILNYSKYQGSSDTGSEDQATSESTNEATVNATSKATSEAHIIKNKERIKELEKKEKEALPRGEPKLVRRNGRLVPLE